MGTCDISFLPFDQIFELCIKYSKGKAKTRKDSREVIERERLEGERIRQEDERKDKEDEDRGSNNKEEKE
jgi:hypothetical protein